MNTNEAPKRIAGNPFPGVNPFIESQKFWRDFHLRLNVQVSTALNAVLPRGLGAFLDERVYVQEEPNLEFLPDVLVLDDTASVGQMTLQRDQENIFDKSDMMAVVVPVRRLENRERFVNIIAADRPEEVITVIEILSPTNKTAGKGRDVYQEKQQIMLDSGTHLIEIDLLRGGLYTLAPSPKDILAAFGRWDFLISLHRSISGQYETYPFTLRDSLPRIPVPLTKPLADVRLDVAELVMRVHAEGGYAKFIDYSKPLVPPVADAETAAWVQEISQKRETRDANPAA